jgi:hypothetical protein
MHQGPCIGKPVSVALMLSLPSCYLQKCSLIHSTQHPKQLPHTPTIALHSLIEGLLNLKRTHSQQLPHTLRQPPHLSSTPHPQQLSRSLHRSQLTQQQLPAVVLHL